MGEVKTYVFALRVGRRQRELVRSLDARRIRLVLTRLALRKKDKPRA